jgi:hypothetical protein
VRDPRKQVIQDPGEAPGEVRKEVRALAMPTRRGVGGDAELALGAPAFVGRDRELAAAARAFACPPALVLIEGEAGIGKTRLLAELLTASAGTAGRVLVAAGSSTTPAT